MPLTLKVNKKNDVQINVRGAIPPIQINPKVKYGQVPIATNVKPPTKIGVSFTFKKATPVNDEGMSKLTYEANAMPKVRGITSKEVTFNVGGFETKGEAEIRIAQLKIDNAKDEVIFPIQMGHKVKYGLEPKATNVKPPTKIGVSFTFKKATPVNDKGMSKLTYEINAMPKVKGTTSKDIAFDVGDFETKGEEQTRKKFNEKFYSSNKKYSSMYETQDGTIYVIIYKKGLIKKLENGKLVDVDWTIKDKTINGINCNFVFQTYDGTIYVSFSNLGLNKLENGKLIKVGNGVQFMYQTKDKAIYVGGLISGLQKLENGKLVNIKSPALIRFMYQTQDGTIYVATQHSIKKLENGELVDVNSIGDALSLLYIYQTKDGTIYLEIPDGVIAPKADKGLKIFKDGQIFNISNINSTHTSFIYQIQDGTIYVGTNDDGLKKLENDKLVDVNSINVNSGFMYQVQDGTIYVGTFNSGMYIL